ncbi:DUF5695 domain-containing protein [Pedobacter antarcticus]|uniref:DUF5695 domain-containing protein n=1 Tax=Pedobacter antarcticus TaxID=34086 RepID=UPI000ABB3400|nr:DUF5695 domain-containing protein [Pedobacter antarcticus]
MKIKMHNKLRFISGLSLLALFTLGTPRQAIAQKYWEKLSARPATLGLAQGTLGFDAGDLQLRLVKSSQTAAALSSKAVKDFDFTPSERLKVRHSDGLYHLGDINLMLRTPGKNWHKYSSATKRAAVKVLKSGGKVLAASDLAPTLAADIPLRVRRYWEMKDGQLVLRFELKNNQ